MTAAPALHTLRVVAGVLPALLVVIFAGVIALIALTLGEERREYALEFANTSVELAAVLVGVPADRKRTAAEISAQEGNQHAT